MIDLMMYKIEIKGSAEHMLRISTFLDNNHIKHGVIDEVSPDLPIEEMDLSIDWPL